MPALVFVLVLAVRAAHWAELERSPLSDWHLWMETDEWGYLDWSAHLAAGNWLDVPAWRSYFSWQEPFGPSEAWERWYPKNAYFAGPLYPYGLALVRVAGLPLLPTVRLLQLLLACMAAAAIAAAAQAIAGRHLLEGGRGTGSAAGVPGLTIGPALAGCVAGLFHGLYGPLVFQDGFAYRDGPVAHVSALLLAWPLLGSELMGERVGDSAKTRMGAFFLGLLGGLAALLKQTLLPLAVCSLYSYSKRSRVGPLRRRAIALSLLGLTIPVMVLAARNLTAGTPPLTFDTRQALGLVWGNGRGADATTAPPATMKGILVEAGGSTWKTARLVLSGYADAPLALPALWAKKLATFFLGYEIPDNSNWYFFRDRLGVLRVLPVFPCIVGAGIVGLCAAIARGVLRTDEGLLAVVAVLMPLAACLLVQTTARYRVGVVPPLALGAGLLVVLFLEKWPSGRRGVVAGMAGALVAVSVVSAFLPSPIPTPRHRWADAIVAATLAEACDGPEAGASEIRRYLQEGTDDRGRASGERAALTWLSGDRSSTRVAPAGVAPPGRRYVAAAEGEGR